MGVVTRTMNSCPQVQCWFLPGRFRRYRMDGFDVGKMGLSRSKTATSSEPWMLQKLERKLAEEPTRTMSTLELPMNKQVNTFTLQI